MFDLEPIKARPAARTERYLEQPMLLNLRAAGPRLDLALIAARIRRPIFSRTRDIGAAIVTELLERAEDPARMMCPALAGEARFGGAMTRIGDFPASARAHASRILACNLAVSEFPEGRAEALATYEKIDAMVEAITAVRAASVQ